MSAVRFLLLLLCLSLSPLPSLSATEAESLLAFKKSLSDSKALDSSWRPDASPCKDKWEGIFCDQGVIIRIHLQGMGLSGPIDVNALSQIPNLRTLSLSENSFSGPIPEFKKLSHLRALYLDNNKFTGEIPADYFSGFSGLRRIWLSHNGFTGKIPESLVKLPQLSALHLENNQLSGSVPNFEQPSLVELNLSDNKLEGPIPPGLERFKADDVFKGNEGLCGKVMGKDCAVVPAASNSTDEAGAGVPPAANSSKSTVGVMIAIVVIMMVLLVLTTALKSKRRDDDFSVLGKEPIDDVVEVRVHTRNGSRKVDGGRVGGNESSGSSTHKKKDKDHDGGGGSKKGTTNNSGGGGGKGGGMGDLIVINHEKGVFGLADLMKAAAEVLGNGGLGSAYKAVMSNGVSVVVKRIRDMNKLDRDEFDTEIRKIGRLSHPNVLTPLAYHYRKEEKLLVSEYISKGSLLYVLHGDRGISHSELDWPTRLKIIRGIASGMRYLHTETEISSIIIPHGNLKSSNILLNENYDPKLSDYGFLPFVNNHQATQGMFAFKSPEAVSDQQQISSKSDVYCLGIVILEILTGKFPSQYLSAGKGGTDVVQWVETAIRENNEVEFIDPEIVSCTDGINDMVRLLHIGAACTLSNPGQRPTMEEAIYKIEETRGL